MTNITRMQLLRGDLKGKKKPFRPPWAIPEEYFVDYCTRCDKCIDACFDELIVKGRGGFPQMDFKKGGCDFCEDCINVCETNALKKIPDNTQKTKEHGNSDSSEEESYLPPWHIKANIDLTNCLSMNATICRSCGESCDDKAIKFDLKLGGIAEPILNIEQCTGCGACFSVCPVQVITLTPIAIENGT
ncbi:MAG: ferredoxin-type protein NapF [Gammaproteobacteria bacterium]|nr:ferredoxin-type protein NapF [Gammaproteobacteria bacterium]